MVHVSIYARISHCSGWLLCICFHCIWHHFPMCCCFLCVHRSGLDDWNARTKNKQQQNHTFHGHVFVCFPLFHQNFCSLFLYFRLIITYLFGSKRHKIYQELKKYSDTRIGGRKKRTIGMWIEWNWVELRGWEKERRRGWEKERMGEREGDREKYIYADKHIKTKEKREKKP